MSTLRTSTLRRLLAGAALLALLVAVPAAAQTTLIPPEQIVRLVNAELEDATLRLHSRGEWSARDRTFYHNDSWVRMAGETRPIALEEVRVEPRTGVGIHYYYNANDIETNAIRLSHEDGRYALNLSFEVAGREVKGLCRWRRTNGDFTQCRPSGNDQPAPDIEFHHFRIRIPIDPEIEGFGFTIPPVRCSDIDIQLDADISGVLGLGHTNLPERIIGRNLRSRIREGLCGLLSEDQAFRSAMGSRTALRLADLPELGGADGARPVRFTHGGALEVRSAPAVLDASVGFEPAGGGCPQEVTARMAVATDRARSVRVRFEDGERMGPWITLQSEPISMGGGSGFAAVAERPLGWELDGGMHRLRMQVEGVEPGQWSRVRVECATRTAPTVVASVVPTEGPRKAGTCPLYVHFTGTLSVQAPGRYTYHFQGQDGSETTPQTFVANAPGTTEVFWNRRVPAALPGGAPPPRTIGGWTQLVVRAEIGRQRPRTIHSERAPFQVVCMNGVEGRRRTPRR